ncbi:MFS transporter [Bacillus solimangrovi]|uniref:Major facilitator superfamily (MFS) profile domain-containing protein n=1 Tax=Bacillus solimangrovi TaxID=1305675 RepID=A0A1E5LFZ4_9BACI|nr:MFS transporter [Bacillus solimangrovi]OEH93007.1 hypothetical protein BFG57_14185 [Bacillus solimangrovi]
MRENKNKLLLPVLAICSFLVGFDLIVTIPLIPLIVNDTDMSIELGGLLVTLYAISYAVSAPILGVLSDRLGRKKMLLLGILIFAVATGFTGYADSFTLLIAFRILSGIGAGMIEPGVLAIASDNYSYERRGRAIGIVTGALISASIIGVPVGSYIAETFNWRWTFWLISLISLITLITVPIVISNDHSLNNAKNDSIMSIFLQLRNASKKSSVVLALLATLLYYGGLQGMFVNVGVFYSSYYDLTAGQIGLVLMIAGLGSVVGSVFGGRIVDRFGKRTIILFSSVFVAILVITLTCITKNLVVAILINVLWATIYGLGQTALNSLISELNPTVRGALMSLNSSAMYIGSALFTAIAATLLYTGSFLWVGILCGAANGIVFLISFVIRERTLNTNHQVQSY